MVQIILFQPSNGFLMDKVDMFPPWALIYASTKIHKKYSIKIIDGRFEKNWKEKLRDNLDESTLCVGVTAMTGINLKFAIEFLKEVKKLSPNVKTVIGGIHVTSDPENSIKEPLVDFVIVGDGETTFYNLVKAIENKNPYENIRGLCFKDRQGNPVINVANKFENLNELDDPPIHLIDVEMYVKKENGRRKFIVLSSRGCPFRCSFCYNSNKFNQGVWRSMSAEKTFKIIKKLKKEYKIDYFVFQDDNFWVDRNRVEKLVSLIERSNIGIKWDVLGVNLLNLKYITPEIAKRLKKSGLEKILSGVETVSPRLKKIIPNKFINVNQLLNINKNMSNAEIQMTYSFMSGFPGETDDDIKMNIDAMFSLKRQNPKTDVGNIKPLIYYPGTELYKWALKNGFKPPKTFEEWGKYSWNNYEALEYPWLDKKRKELLQNIYFSTLLLMPDYLYINNPLWKFISILTRPIIKWRIKKLFFKFSPSLFTLKLIKKMDLI